MSGNTALRRPPLPGACIFLLVLSVIFYAALYYFTHGLAALRTQQGLMLGVGFCVVFSLYLGVSGWRVSKRLWLAPLLHTVLAAGLLVMDIPLEMLWRDMDVTALLLGSVLVVTTAGGVWAGLREKMRR